MQRGSVVKHYLNKYSWQQKRRQWNNSMIMIVVETREMSEKDDDSDKDKTKDKENKEKKIIIKWFNYN